MEMTESLVDKEKPTEAVMTSRGKYDVPSNISGKQMLNSRGKIGGHANLVG
jgi:hypothetical protein